jgi:excisionase family DNA binding protein
VVINLELFTVSEVSKLLKVNNTYVYKLIKTGYLKALKLGSLKVPDSELKRFIDFSIGKDFSDLDNIKDLL